MKTFHTSPRESQYFDLEVLAHPLLSIRTPGVRYVETAKIATSEPLVKDAIIQPGTKVYVVGNDGANLKPPYKHWLTLLESWLRVGCEVNYLLLDPTAVPLAPVTDLARKFADRSRLTIYTMDRSKPLPKPVAALAKRWVSFHFVVFENPRQLWIELCHLPGQTEAKDCYFFPKKVAAKPGIIDVYKAQFDYVVPKFTRVLLAPRSSVYRQTGKSGSTLRAQAVS